MSEEGDYQSRNNETLGCGTGKGTTARNMHHQKEVLETRWICGRSHRRKKMNNALTRESLVRYGKRSSIPIEC